MPELGRAINKSDGGFFLLEGAALSAPIGCLGCTLCRSVSKNWEALPARSWLQLGLRLKYPSLLDLGRERLGIFCWRPRQLSIRKSARMAAGRKAGDSKWGGHSTSSILSRLIQRGKQDPGTFLGSSFDHLGTIQGPSPAFCRRGAYRRLDAERGILFDPWGGSFG